MIINHNLGASNALRNMSINSGNGSKSMEKLSSGLRINRAGDDAAGLAISEKMRGQIRGLDQSSSNAQDGISLIQTAEGALNETHSILQRMRELAVQSANDTNTSTNTAGTTVGDRGQIQQEVDQLKAEIKRISTDTEFNTQKLLDGSFTDRKFHIGANQDQEISLTIGDMSDTGLGVSGVTIEQQSDANTSITTIQNAIDKVSTERSKLGAYQNRLEHTINNLGTSSENLTAAESRIRDVDMAKEMAQYSKFNILSQASQAMLAQANQQPQQVLQLLR